MLSLLNRVHNPSTMLYNLEEGEEDVALEKVSMGPKLVLPQLFNSINPPWRVATLSNDWSANQASCKRVDISSWEKSDKFCVVLDNILTTEECKNLIELSERRDYEKALVNVGRGNQELMQDVRNNDRCIYDDPHVVEQIWQRILNATQLKDSKIHGELFTVPWIHERYSHRNKAKTYQAVGVNERMRFLRYDPGTYFAPHFDGSYVRDCEAGVER